MSGADAHISIPVSVIVVTKNEEARIGACLAALSAFDDVWVVDSGSTDRTKDIASECGAKVQDYAWNGVYPKKRQWCLDTLALKHDYVFFVDADEVVPPETVEETAALDYSYDGYFVSARYVFEGRVLRFGLRNNKLALFNRHKIGFPVIDDLDIPGMGEIEGHYQPVFLTGERGQIGRLRTSMLHDACDDIHGWYERHERYARWEAGMNARDAWPSDPLVLRQFAKRIFRAMPCRHVAAFLQSYIFKLGFLDGGRGYRFAKRRAQYYAMISKASKDLAGGCAETTTRSALQK